MKIKYSYDNVGGLVITDGETYVGFCEPKHPKEIYIYERPLSGQSFLAFDEEGIKYFGIDKITDWKEYIIPQ